MYTVHLITFLEAVTPPQPSNWFQHLAELHQFFLLKVIAASPSPVGQVKGLIQEPEVISLERNLGVCFLLSPSKPCL